MNRTWTFWFKTAMSLCAVCLLLPVDRYGRGETTLGLWALLSGWIDVLATDSCAWLANPILGVAWICLLLRKARSAMVLCAVALVFALTFLLAPTLHTGMFDAARTTKHYPHFGYFVWLAAIVCTWIAARKLRVEMLESAAPIMPAQGVTVTPTAADGNTHSRDSGVSR